MARLLIRRPGGCRILLCSLTFSFIAANASGTSVDYEETRCPICQESFVVIRYVTLSVFGYATARDLRDSQWIVFEEVRTCPHCLYTSLASEFSNVDPAERATIRDFLATLGSASSRMAWKSQDNGIVAPKTDADATFWLGHRCYDRRGPKPRSHVRLALLQYYQCGRTASGTRCEYREHAIDEMDKALRADAYLGPETAMVTYLRGELLRVAGRLEEARRELAAARKLALTAKVEYPESATLKWLLPWIEERSLLAKMGSMDVPGLLAQLQDVGSAHGIEDGIDLATRAALATVAGRSDPEALQALKDYAERSPANAHWRDYVEVEAPSATNDKEVLRAMLPALHKAPPVRTYPLPASQSLAAAADALGTSCDRLMKLNPSAQAERMGDEPWPILVPALPDGWSEDRLAENLIALIRDGDEMAARVFLDRFRSKLGGDLLRWDVQAGMRALAGTPSLWPLFESLEAPDGDSELALRLDALAYVCGQTNRRDRLVARVRMDALPDEPTFFILDCFILKKDDCLKDLAFRTLARWSEPDVACFHPCDYLQGVGNAGDLPKLKALATQTPRGLRRDIEDAIRAITIREKILTR